MPMCVGVLKRDHRVVAYERRDLFDRADGPVNGAVIMSTTVPRLKWTVTISPSPVGVSEYAIILEAFAQVHRLLLRRE